MKCAWKTCINDITPGRRFCDVKCKRKFFVDKRRKALKQQAIEYKGGACSKCGYDKCAEALAFHHRDPGTKEFGLAERGVTHSWEKMRAELDKCDLICANCHAEAHALERVLIIASR